MTAQICVQFFVVSGPVPPLIQCATQLYGGKQDTNQYTVPNVYI